MKIITEDYFDILENNDKELLLAISAKEEDFENPVLLYAGGDDALLCRSKNQIVALNKIHDAVKDQLSCVTQILVAEMQEKEVKHEYVAKVKMLTTLPVLKDYSLEILDKMKEDANFANQVLLFYTKLADDGNADAQFALSQILMYGKSVEENYSLGLEYLGKAAEQGHEEARLQYLEYTEMDDDGRYDAWV